MEDNNGNSIIIRKATPLDVVDCVNLMYSTGSYYFDFLFNINTDKFAEVFGALAHGFTAENGIFSYKYTTVAEQDGKILGMERSFSNFEFKWENIAICKYMIGYYGLWKALKILPRSLVVDRIIPRLPRKSWLIYQLAVVPEARGLGIGTILLNHRIANINKIKNARIFIDVAETNPRAEKLYKSLGFNLFLDQRFPEITNKYHIPGGYRLIYQKACVN